MSDRALHPYEIPRGTCQLFGAIKALNTIRGCTILVHGPKGCVYHINYILGMRGDRPSHVYSTCLDEKGVIFGAGEILVSAIEELDRELRPELIAVLSCCASSIIGEDVEQAVRSAHTEATVIPFEAGGFGGDFREGYSRTLQRLAEVLPQAPERVDPSAVNLIGLLRAGPDLSEIRRILEENGIRVNGVLTAGARISELRRLGEAALNIVVCEYAGRGAAIALQQRFGTPFVIEELPIGFSATRRFLRRVAAHLGFTPEPRPEERVPVRQPAPRRMAVVGGPTRAVAMARFLNELGMRPCLVAMDFSPSQEAMEELRHLADRILVEPSQEELIGALRGERVDLIIGGMLERPVAALLGIDHIDIMHGSQKTVGFTGGRHLLRILEDLDSRDNPDTGV